MAVRKTHGEGTYDLVKTNPEEIEFEDFLNPWTFHCLFVAGDDNVYKWMRDHGLLAKEIACHHCEKTATLMRRSKKKDGYTFRCSSGHEFGMRKFSFFEGSSYNMRDIMMFIRYYLEGRTLHQCSIAAGMDYKCTAVNWASYIRELFCEYVFNTYNMTQFEGDVEIDESLFGRKIKYNKGKPRGHRIWIFGIIHRQTNKIILYPVNKRDADTLIPIIQRHVYPGSTIFSDSWAAYLGLNALGYQHFSVTHKTTFKQTYQNVQTGETLECHTNQIEGAWKICKDHFRRINGTKSRSFEQHLAEVVWRNHTHKLNLFRAFFDLMRNYFTLTGPPSYTYTRPLFDTWTPPSAAEEKDHNVTIIQDIEAVSDGSDSEDPHPQAIVPLASTPKTHSEKSIAAELSESLSLFSYLSVNENVKSAANKDSSDESVWEYKNDKKLAFPKKFKPVIKSKAKLRKNPTKKLSNPYGRDAFVYEMSSDSDFV